MAELKDKVVVITGAANGLGKALAKEFYKFGYHLALVDIDDKGLYQIKSEFQKSHQKITTHIADVADEQTVIKIRRAILEAHQRVDILINNAAVSISKIFEQLDLTDYKHLFDINFWGSIYFTKHFLPDLKNQTDSRLVNIISDFALMGFLGKTAYGSSKSAVMGFTNSLSTELAGTSVRVCVVIPPPLNTGLVRNSKHINETKKHLETAFLQKNGMPLEKAARRIVGRVEEGKFKIVIGAMMFWLDLASRLFPTTLHYLIGKYKNRIDFV